MSDRVISADLLEDGTTVSIERGVGVPDDAWLQLRVETSATGRGVARRIEVPLEHFLARRSGVGRLVNQQKIKVRIGERLRALVVQANRNSEHLRRALSDDAGLSAEELEVRLAESRFSRPLRPFQQRDLARLLALDNGANFSVPGAGKTTVAYAAYEAERVAGRVERLLVVAPLSAFGSWRDEADVCFSDPPVVGRFVGERIPNEVEVLLANYQRLDSGFDVLADWVTERPTMVLLDEAHRMKKGWGGTWGTACLNLAYLAARRDILTGTPAPQGPKDFVALVDFLWPGQARRILPASVLVGEPPVDAGSRVAAAIEPLFVRTSKAELALPSVEREAIVLPLEGLHRDVYMALKNRYAGKLALGRESQRNFRSMGRVTMYLLEAATNPKLLTAGSKEHADPDVFQHPPLDIEAGTPLAVALARFNKYHTPNKFKQLLRLIRQNAEQGRKTLVWSNFVRNLELLVPMLRIYEPALIHGAVPAVAPEGELSREVEISRFRHDADCMVLLANPAAMSEGISLHRQCHDAIYLERTFNAGQFLQSIDRIHRLGLKPDDETRITFLLTEETIDMTVDDRVRVKAERLGEMLDDPALSTVALPNEEDYGTPIDDDLDVEALFAHLRGEDA